MKKTGEVESNAHVAKLKGQFILLGLEGRSKNKCRK